MVPVPLLLCTIGTGTNFLVSVPLAGYAHKMADFAISHPFFFTIPPQILPTSKPTMESTQNNSKSGLEPIKTPFSQLGLFPKIKIIKGEVRVLFSYLKSVQIFPCRLLDLLEARSGKESHHSLILSQALTLSPFSPPFLSQNGFAPNELP